MEDYNETIKLVEYGRVIDRYDRTRRPAMGRIDMFILYFALWVILNGKWTTEIGAFGVAFAAIAYLFTCKFMGYSLSLDFALLRRAPHAIRYGCMLFVEIIKANLTVMRMVLDREFEPKPQLVKFDVNLKKERHRVALANSITLTPGTITVNLEDNHYQVHCLDASLIDGLDNGGMVAALEKLERMHMSAPAAVKAEETVTEETAAQETVSEEAAAQENAEEAAEDAQGEGASAQEEKNAEEDEHEH